MPKEPPPASPPSTSAGPPQVNQNRNLSPELPADENSNALFERVNAKFESRKLQAAWTTLHDYFQGRPNAQA